MAKRKKRPPIPTGFPELPSEDARIHKLGSVLIYLIMRNKNDDSKTKIVQSSANARQQTTKAIKALKRQGIDNVGKFVSLSKSDYHTYPALGRKRLALLDECHELLHRPNPENPKIDNSVILSLTYYAEEPIHHLSRLLSLLAENPGSPSSKRLAARVVALLGCNYVTTIKKFATMPRYNFNNFYGLGDKSMSMIEACRKHLVDNNLVK